MRRQVDSHRYNSMLRYACSPCAEHLFTQKAGSRDFASSGAEGPGGGFLARKSRPDTPPVLSSRDRGEDGDSISVLGNGFQVRVHPIEKYDFRRVEAHTESIKDVADAGSVFYFHKIRSGPPVGRL
jgi:hypothetical protein